MLHFHLISQLLFKDFFYCGYFAIKWPQQGSNEVHSAQRCRLDEGVFGFFGVFFCIFMSDFWAIL